MIKLYRTCNVSINKILHVDRPVYNKEGYAGKTVFSWPIYRFFKLYHSGQKEKALQSFTDWYTEQYKKYSGCGKSKGGMKGGTLEKLYHNLQKNYNGNTSFENAVEIRVKQRFSLFESILTQGYIINESAPLQALKTNNDQFILLNGGHHRVAILAAIGYNEIPMVYVFMNKTSYYLNKYSKKVISLMSLKA